MPKQMWHAIPLDDAIKGFLSRIVATGHTLHYINSYTFNRKVDAPYQVTITFYADEELVQFGAEPIDPDVEPDDTATIMKRDAPTKQ